MVKYIALIGLLGSFTPLIQTSSEPPVAAAIQLEAPRESLSNNGAAVQAQNKIDGIKITPKKPSEVYYYPITAYSSSPEETDETPYITASGNYVRIGTAAANWLPLGTAIRIPSIFGNQVFIIEDRMNARNNNKVDIWFPDKKDAKTFGVKIARIEVL